MPTAQPRPTKRIVQRGGKRVRVHSIGYTHPETGKPTSPLPAQQAFHASLAPYRAYVGGFGSGKTICGSKEAIKLSLKYPGNRGLIGRRYFPELRESTMDVFFRRAMPEALRQQCQWSEARRELTFPNGSKIFFRHLENPMQFRSMELGWFWLDEAIESGCEEAWRELKHRLRLTGVGRRCAWVTSNPGSQSSYLYQEFEKPSLLTRSRYFVVRAPSTQNIYLPSDYMSRLHEMDDVDYRTFVGGHWFTAKGCIWDNFSHEVHVVQPFPIPDEWPCIRSIDFGIRHAFACTWWAIDQENNRAFCYREWVVPDLSLPQNISNVISLSEGENIVYTVIDPAAKARSQQTGLTTLDQVQELGIPCIPGNNDVDSSIRRIRGLLNYGVDKNAQIVKTPHLYFFNTCATTVSQIASYQWEEKRGVSTGKPLKKHDDAVDSVRYAVMQFQEISPAWEMGHYVAPVLTEGQIGLRKAIESNVRWNMRRRGMIRRGRMMLGARRPEVPGLMSPTGRLRTLV